TGVRARSDFDINGQFTIVMLKSGFNVSGSSDFAVRRKNQTALGIRGQRVLFQKARSRILFLRLK
ncbi:hypothetical protein HMPREF9554_01264, partial [Treponema phagedenis F0421]|uniref:hypothetical protein n=1 Tax=Treponema phagedenis TaxID=162 RepID=UPI0001F63BCD